MEKQKLFTVDFLPMWPVPSGLVILAKNIKEARNLAKETITHTKVQKINEVKMDESKVVFYESGDY